MNKNKKIKIALIITGVIAVAAIAVVLIMMNKKDDYRVLKVESFTGTVDLSRNDKSEELFEGMNLKSKDVVTTGKESMIGILADSDKHIIAEENTCFSIVSAGDEKKGSLSITLEYGTSLFTIDNKLNEDSSFDVNTPNAAMSVRGTTFKVCYDKEKNETTLDVTQGSVQVTTSTESKLIEAGNSINIIGNEGEIVETSNKIVFKADEGEEYADFFTYVYDSENDGYILNGYSEIGYNKLITYDSECTVEVTFPKSYNGKAVIGIGAADEADNFSMSLWTMNAANQEWVLPEEWVEFIGNESGNNLTVSMDNVTFNEEF